MARILSLGMAVLDHVFQIDAFPASGEKYRAKDYTTQAGGPATVAAVSIARLGGEAVLCTRLGRDANSNAILASLASAGVDCSPTVVSDETSAPVSSVYVDASGERQIVNFRGKGLPEAASMLPSDLLNGFDAVVADQRWPQGALRVATMAQDAGIPAVIDAENDIAALLPAMNAASHVVFSTPGLLEFTQISDAQDAIRAAAERLPCWVAVTRGSAGVSFFTNGVVDDVPAFQVTARDTLGAGDVWHGAFALALGEGASERDAIIFANAAAALKCAHGSGWRALPGKAETLALARSTGQQALMVGM